MTGQRIGYIRVSSFDQHTERQLENILVDKVYVDKSSDKNAYRPQLIALMESIGEGDTLVIHSMDRLAKNLDDLHRIVASLTQKGVAIEFVKEHLKFTSEATPMANLMLSIMSAFAQFERALIKERQREGIAIAKLKGVYKGRKKALSPEQINELKTCLSNGEKKAQVARKYGISRETLYQYLRA